jgi:hypothetical protein
LKTHRSILFILVYEREYPLRVLDFPQVGFMNENAP